MSRLSRRTLLGGGLGLAVAGGLTAAAAGTVRAVSARGGGGALRIGYLPITDASPLLVAHATGLYRRHGVTVADPVRFRGWAELAQAFVVGRVDVVHLLMPFAVQLRYDLGAAVRVVAWSHTNGSALTLDPRLGGVADLAGRSIAIPYWWSVHNLLVQRMLRGAGLTPVIRRRPSREHGEVRLLVMSPSDMVSALQDRVVGGFVVADPFNAMAEVKGVGRIARFTGDVWRRHACCVVVMRQETIDADPARAEAFVTAVAAAQLAIRADRPGTAATLADGLLPQPRLAIARALGYPAEPYLARGALRHPGWDGARIDFAPFPFPSYTEQLVRAMRETVVDLDTRFLDALDPAAVHADLVDDRFARAAVDRLGGPAAFDLPAALARAEETAQA